MRVTTVFLWRLGTPLWWVLPDRIRIIVVLRRLYLHALQAGASIILPPLSVAAPIGHRDWKGYQVRQHFMQWRRARQLPWLPFTSRRPTGAATVRGIRFCGFSCIEGGPVYETTWRSGLKIFLPLNKTKQRVSLGSWAPVTAVSTFQWHLKTEVSAVHFHPTTSADICIIQLTNKQLVDLEDIFVYRVDMTFFIDWLIVSSSQHPVV